MFLCTYGSNKEDRETPGGRIFMQACAKAVMKFPGCGSDELTISKHIVNLSDKRPPCGRSSNMSHNSALCSVPSGLEDALTSFVVQPFTKEGTFSITRFRSSVCQSRLLLERLSGLIWKIKSRIKFKCGYWLPCSRVSQHCDTIWNQKANFSTLTKPPVYMSHTTKERMALKL